MKNIAGNIIRRLLAITIFLGFSAVVCCGVASNSNGKAVVCNRRTVHAVKIVLKICDPSQLVFIRIMQLI